MTFMTLKECADALAPYIVIQDLIILLQYVLMGVLALTAYLAVDKGIRKFSEGSGFLLAFTLVFVLCGIATYASEAITYKWAATGYWMGIVGKTLLIPATAWLIWEEFRGKIFTRLFQSESRALKAEAAQQLLQHEISRLKDLASEMGINVEDI